MTFMKPFNPSELPPISVIWYQAPSDIATDSIHYPYYEKVMQVLEQRQDTFPNLQFEFIFDPETNTINFAGETLLFVNLEQDLYNAGFRPMDIPNQGMDEKQRFAFREMILRGGRLHG